MVRFRGLSWQFATKLAQARVLNAFFLEFMRRTTRSYVEKEATVARGDGIKWPQLRMERTFPDYLDLKKKLGQKRR